MSLQAHATLNSLSTAQHAAEGFIFGPVFCPYSEHCDIRSGTLPPHCAETSFVLHIKHPATTNVANPK